MPDTDYDEKERGGLHKGSSVAKDTAGHRPKDDKLKGGENHDTTEGSAGKATANSKESGRDFVDAKRGRKGR